MDKKLYVVNGNRGIIIALLIIGTVVNVCVYLFNYPAFKPQSEGLIDCLSTSLSGKSKRKARQALAQIDLTTCTALIDQLCEKKR